jgi:hypothetical protein
MVPPERTSRLGAPPFWESDMADEMANTNAEPTSRTFESTAAGSPQADPPTSEGASSGAPTR